MRRVDSGRPARLPKVQWSILGARSRPSDGAVLEATEGSSGPAGVRSPMRLSAVPGMVCTAVAAAAVVYAIRTKQSHGTFLRVPFEFRVPTVRRLRERLWNPEDGRLFTPQVFGVGWAVNGYRAAELLGLVQRRDEKEKVEPS